MRVVKLVSRLSTLLLISAVVSFRDSNEIGREAAIPHHLLAGEEFTISLPKLLQYGEQLFRANGSDISQTR